VLNAHDARELVGWLRTRRMMHAEGGYAIVHAGLLPQWSVQKALSLGKEVESALSARNYREFVANMYGSTPSAWSDGLTGWDRQRVIVNAMTRMRFCTRDGRMEFQAKGVDPPPGYIPWYAPDQTRRKTSSAAIGRRWPEAYRPACGPRLRVRMGRQADALRLEDRALYQVPMPRLSVRGRRRMSDCVFLQDRGEADPRDRGAGRCRHDAGFPMDIGQVNPGHVLVALKSHADNLFGLQDAQAAAVFRTVARVARAIRDAFAAQGLSVYQANGKAARTDRVSFPRAPGFRGTRTTA